MERLKIRTKIVISVHQIKCLNPLNKRGSSLMSCLSTKIDKTDFISVIALALCQLNP